MGWELEKQRDVGRENYTKHPGATLMPPYALKLVVLRLFYTIIGLSLAHGREVWPATNALIRHEMGYGIGKATCSMALRWCCSSE